MFDSDWPTIPQVYLKGEFLGGCDIILGMHQSGELTTVGRRCALYCKDRKLTRYSGLRADAIGERHHPTRAGTAD